MTSSTHPHVECVIVCRDYDDFLEHSLPENLNHLDDVIVVTSHEDEKTKSLCRKHSVHFIETDVFTERGHVFNKGLAINAGLNELRCDSWVLHLDADIVLPRHFRRSLEHAQIRPENIYGADRMNVYGYEAWQNLKPQLDSPWQSGWFLDPGSCHQPQVPEGVRFGARVINRERGYLPIGYFQLFHGKHGRRYNYKRGAAAGTDCNFPMQWPRANRVLLPDIVVWHLDSEPVHGIGTNWKGRKSRPFKPLSSSSEDIYKKPHQVECHKDHERRHQHKNHHCHHHPCHDYDCRKHRSEED